MDESPALRAAKEKANPPQPWDRPQGGFPDAPKGITAADLVRLELPPARFAIDDLLAEGLTVLGGKPKHGKSWLALMLGWAVAAGMPIDGRRSLQGEVLYLALEDTRRRLQSRIRSLQQSLGWVVPETLCLQTEWPRSHEGGLYWIAEWLSARKGVPRFVIVDTLAKFRKPPKGLGNSYAEDYEAVGGLKATLDNYESTGLLLHHTRKLRAEDPFDELSGTLAIAGASDSLWMLDTTEKGAEAQLYATGRDLPDSTTALSFSKGSGRWVFGLTQDGIDTSGRQTASTAQNKVDQCMDWLRSFLSSHAYPSKEITDAGRKAGFPFSTVRDAKGKLGKNGTGEITSVNLNGEWWCGKGSSAGWTFRPATEKGENA